MLRLDYQRFMYKMDVLKALLTVSRLQDAVLLLRLLVFLQLGTSCCVWCVGQLCQVVLQRERAPRGDLQAVTTVVSFLFLVCAAGHSVLGLRLVTPKLQSNRVIPLFQNRYLVLARRERWQTWGTSGGPGGEKSHRSVITVLTPQVWTAHEHAGISRDAHV